MEVSVEKTLNVETNHTVARMHGINAGNVICRSERKSLANHSHTRTHTFTLKIFERFVPIYFGRLRNNEL